MTDYISYPIETDSGTLTQEAFDYMASKVPGWLPSEGNLDVWLLEAIAQMAAELRDVASDVPVTIFRYFGKTLIGLPPIDGTQAALTATFTMRDTLGHTIPNGALVQVLDSSGDPHGFTVTGPIVIGSGSSVANNVPLVAADEGVGLTGYTPPDGSITMIDALAYVLSITSASMISGGVDAETDEAYLSRLSAELQLLTPAPILPNDYAILALLVPSVGRALAIDGYDPSGPTFGNARTVAVAVSDAAGLALSGAVKTAVQTLLAGYREVNFLVNVIDPSYTTITVVSTIKVVAGFDLTDVDTRVTQAVNDYISPANWGLPLTGDTPNWVQRQTLRFFDMVQIIKDVQGVDYIVSLTVNGGVADVGLTGVAPLTLAGATNITAT